jgi:thiamine monophosphate synthase
LVVAIGGIGAENAGEIFRAGADSLAIIKAILFPAEEIAENLSSLLASDS